MKASFLSVDETEKNAKEGKVPRSTGDVGSWINTNIGSGNMPSTKYGFCYTMKKGMAFKCHSPIILRPGAFSWQEY
jgi:hypothetical protein